MVRLSYYLIPVIKPYDFSWMRFCIYKSKETEHGLVVHKSNMEG